MPIRQTASSAVVHSCAAGRPPCRKTCCQSSTVDNEGSNATAPFGEFKCITQTIFVSRAGGHSPVRGAPAIDSVEYHLLGAGGKEALDAVSKKAVRDRWKRLSIGFKELICRARYIMSRLVSPSRSCTSFNPELNQSSPMRDCFCTERLAATGAGCGAWTVSLVASLSHQRCDALESS